ncbi:MAG TPA: NADH-quinone oxidoreductase subunit D [Candidatus Hydrogenedentes bacterium]|nr:NADH-quinone oxidoreductase subunit D [Candidatus Hydrogenedentota bacterium]
MAVKVKTLEELLKPPAEAASALSTQEYYVNMGPQHPISHGSLRFVVRLDGETAKEVMPVPGYVHRGIEKMCEHLSYRQMVHLSDRMDYFSALMGNWAVSKTVEHAAGIELNDRIEIIRTIMAELQRVQSHVLWWAVLGMDMGAATAFLYGFREREIIGEIFEETIGARLTMNYIQPGGVMYDIQPGFVAKVKKLISYLRPVIDEYDTLLSGNVILQERLRNVGVLDPKLALSMGCTGPVLRASGVPLDLRKVQPYGAYAKADFNVAVGSKGDSWDRYYVRVQEMRESLRIVEQLLDGIPEGPHMVMKPAVRIKVPEGMFYGQLETSRGILGLTLVSDGKGAGPIRAHFRSPNYNNLWVISALAPGWRVADTIAILSSLDLVIPEIDR